MYHDVYKDIGKRCQTSSNFTQCSGTLLSIVDRDETVVYAVGAISYMRHAYDIVSQGWGRDDEWGFKGTGTTREGRPIKKKTLWTIISICLVVVLFLVWLYNLLLKKVWNFLIVHEEPKPSDVIIVLEGGNGYERVEYGVSLYQLGYANKTLFTGGAGTHNMARHALSLGVTEDHILIEDKSYSTFTNAKYSLDIVRSQGFESAIVVTHPYHTKRASIIFDQIFQGLDLTICSVPYDSSIANSWWKDKRAATAVITEYMKLVYHYLFER